MTIQKRNIRKEKSTRTYKAISFKFEQFETLIEPYQHVIHAKNC